MSAARDAILGRIRAALGDAPPPPPAPRTFRRAGTADRAELVAGFMEKAGGLQGAG